MQPSHVFRVMSGMFSDPLINQIEQAWTHRSKPAMNKQYLAELMRIVFFASLRREEGQEVAIRIAVIEREQLGREQFFAPCLRFLPFLPEPELSVDLAVKLSGALDTRTSTLVAVPNGQSFKVAGIAYFGPHASRLDPDPSSCPAHQALSVVARQPGQLLIAYANGLIGRVTDGKFIAGEPTPLVSSKLGGALLDRVKAHRGFQKHEIAYWQYYSAALERLLELSAARGHGGTILWVPNEATNLISTHVDVRRPFSAAPDISEPLDEILNADAREHAIRPKVSGPSPAFVPVDAVAAPVLRNIYKRRINEHLALLAQLTCVDGALIVDELLRPLGFSAVIKQSPEWTGPVVSKSQVSPGQVDLTKVGTRHKSAVTFAANCAGAVAFVVSQDGPVRGIMRSGDEVWWWPDCFSSVFLD